MRVAAALIVLLSWSAPAAARAAPAPRAAAADTLAAQARAHLARGTVDTRRMALRELEQATLLAPERADLHLELGRAYYACGFLKYARRRFELVSRLTPQDPAARFGLGQVWRRDWLKYLDPTSLDRAIDNFSEAARRDPAHPESWVMLSPLLVAKGLLPAARAAAEHALDVAPGNGDAQLAAASAAWRLGDTGRADSLFERALPRLDRRVRACFEDISPIATERDTMLLHQLPYLMQLDFVRSFWKEHDPDPTTKENEAQLEYWARCTQAYFLYYDAKRREWDERGELYVRYGPPDSAQYNPIGSPMVVHMGTYGEFPANVLVWRYRDLGMNVTLQDRLLSEYYLLPIRLDADADPRPDPDSLAAHGDALATHDARGVFPKYPPGSKPIGVAGSVARFEGDAAPRLLAQLETRGSPADSLWAEWVVLDSTELEVARASRPLSPAPCDPAARRTAEFAAPLAPGPYHVAIAVRGKGGRRGVYRTDVRLEPAAAALELSDLVITCGAPDVGAGAVQLGANPGATVEAGQPLTAYFEIYHLQSGSDGLARFEYVYTVRSDERDPRIWVQRMFAPRPQPTPLVASRTEENPGALRRQFLSAPIQSLPPGRYRLDIVVRDRIAGTEARQSAPFTHLAAPAPAGTGGGAGALGAGAGR
ncbi:MAG TPA: GWxTD domain-containing protein [Candidatus Saccharimonadaceae bacterium]|nr:GWxTD domain-containing protein [Candidatus Saccharimonadaceae bacterium]